MRARSSRRPSTGRARSTSSPELRTEGCAVGASVWAGSGAPTTSRIGTSFNVHDRRKATAAIGTVTRNTVPSELE